MAIDSYRVGEKNHFLKAILIILCIIGFASLLIQAVVAMLVFVITPTTDIQLSPAQSELFTYIANFSPLASFITFILACFALIYLLRKGYVTQGSYFSRLLFMVVLFAVIVLLILPSLIQWLYPFNCQHITANSESLCSIQKLNYPTRIASLICSIIPYLIFSYGCFIIIRLFKNYERGLVFIKENVNLYNKIGWSALLWAILKPLAQALQTFILSLHLGPGYYTIRILIQESSYIAGFIGLLIVIISYVMREGQRLQEQEDYTV
ncbi:hypothetical protein Psal006b_01942 [Piscirickettsia salmonis]|uniref:Membrane protein n=2 Tax=Piscirickettsia salmonis TaxID=1238 RepID=A0A1L6TAX3_PISSA|nr:DUF2975 domain-containing protein [Piscirickettsia salmonis]AKP73664.1 hypothetical protein PSLF89_1859 [Piscirickettsia salmonis LF-89 = ATCC VR-1361]ALB22452.1 membrane protein [Piscirickettsia salmonis]ALY02515.1 hypothetical protein AWE47_06350 [Piscirickettsia salmonis]AMA42036.1 hypothetical protein AWJ11_06375 [Piscirickettsia salmonis]AOS34504.1 hypothetical protein AVM72_03535 [Piscirickettsia salmonis]